MVSRLSSGEAGNTQLRARISGVGSCAPKFSVGSQLGQKQAAKPDLFICLHDVCLSSNPKYGCKTFT